MTKNNNIKPIIGLEVHIELSTKSKMFCGCPADHFAKKPNTNVCPICLGLPGALPYVNNEALDETIKLGVALNCEVAQFSKFDRKHYFYPDLPKGYQISQYDLPLNQKGHYEMGTKRIRIRRIHLEEDTAKLVHETVKGNKVSLVDFNRSGVPLVEMVTEPDFDNAKDATDFLKEIQLIVKYLGISSADMEKGSMRLEANISISTDGKLPDYKVELKNINSFKFLEKALNAEIERQKEMIKSGKKIVQETRGYDQKKDTTFSQREKEEAQDYRYFPEPDIPPLNLSKKRIDFVKKQVGELPKEKFERYTKELGLPKNYAEVLIQTPNRAELFEDAVLNGGKHKIKAKMIADAMVNAKIDNRFKSGTEIVEELVKVTRKDYSGEEETGDAVQKVLKMQKKAVGDYKDGKTEVLGFLIGMVQKELQGKGNPAIIRKLLSKSLK